MRETGWVLPKLPFRIGRVSDAKEMEALDLNDLWIIDAKPYQVSRNHLSIDQWETGRYVVRDRGSFLGTVVNGQQIGGKSKSRMAELKTGDNTLAVGSVDSPYIVQHFCTGEVERVQSHVADAAEISWPVRLPRL